MFWSSTKFQIFKKLVNSTDKVYINNVKSFSRDSKTKDEKSRRQEIVTQKKIYKPVMDKQNNSKLKNLSLNNEFEKFPTIDWNLYKNLKTVGLLYTGGSINVLNKEMLNDLIKHKLVKRIGSNEQPCFLATNDEIKVLGPSIIKL